MSRPLLLGHRGARGVKAIPENTLASFDRALADGCDGFEFDVRLTGDGQAVVCHDPRVGRKEVAHTASDELPTLPRLRDVLARYGDAFLDIELKVSGLERIVIEALRERRPRQFVVSSYLPEVLVNLHDEDATVPMGLICETKAQLARWREMPIAYVIPQCALVDETSVRQIKNAGKRILVWTANTREEMLRCADLGVGGIISDNTVLLCNTLTA